LDSVPATFMMTTSKSWTKSCCWLFSSSRVNRYSTV